MEKGFVWVGKRVYVWFCLLCVGCAPTALHSAYARIAIVVAGAQYHASHKHLLSDGCMIIPPSVVCF